MDSKGGVVLWNGMKMRSIYYVTLTMLSACIAQDEAGAGSQTSIEVFLREVEVTQPDQYFTETVALPHGDLYIVEFIPHAQAEWVHHMLVYGCDHPAFSPGERDSRGKPMGSKCSSGEKLLYGWAKDAPGLVIPPNVGVPIGPSVAVNFIVIEVHFLQVPPPQAWEGLGVVLQTTAESKQYKAGLMSFAARFTIPPRTNPYEVTNACCYTGHEPLHLFAFRYVASVNPISCGIARASLISRQVSQERPPLIHTSSHSYATISAEFQDL